MIEKDTAKKKQSSCKTVDIIKDAFLTIETRKIFNEISITEICREAQISRSTFYQYYNNLAELLDEVLSDVCSYCTTAFAAHNITDHNELQEIREKEKMCEFVRRNKKYQGLFCDESLTSKIIEGLISKSSDKEMFLLQEMLCMSRDELLFFQYYQLNGCLAVIRKTTGMGDADWKKARDMLDRFVESSVLSLKYKNPHV